MRIIAGSARGRRLHSPDNLRIRPTADRVKESLFNILVSLRGGFDGCRVLDLFAGTGNLGFEALSRGAAQAVFVDDQRESVALIIKNLRLLGFAEKGQVLERKALAAMRNLEKQGIAFDLVFIDPPYRQGLAEEALRHLDSSPLLDEDAVVIAECSADEEMATAFASLREFDRRVYGDTALHFFRRGGADGAN